MFVLSYYKGRTVISISENRLFKIIKIGLILLSLYSFTFCAIKTIAFIQYYYEKKLLKQSIATNKAKIETLKQKDKIAVQKLNTLKESYLSQDDLSKKLQGIFVRMSLPDYRLQYITSTQMCIDRYAIMVQLDAKNPNGLKAGKGILSYLGKIQKSKQEESVYFIDYILKAKGN